MREEVQYKELKPEVKRLPFPRIAGKGGFLQLYNFRIIRSELPTRHQLTRAHCIRH